MEFKDMNIPECSLQQIDCEWPFAGIMVNVGNVDVEYPNFKKNDCIYAHRYKRKTSLD